MNITDDLTLDIRHGKIKLSSNGRTIEYDYTPTRSGGGIFADGPVKWRDIEERYLIPALYQLASDRAL